MSINVTVTGNPVNIKRGKMVCHDQNYCKKEFEKRRRMRLEQVRQQSKEIAEDVREKVRKQKKKQLSELETEGEEKLKKWQARKLLELQTQYKEAIRDIGSAHKEATILPSDSDIILQEKENNDRISRDRGQKALEKSQIEKNDASYKKALPRQQRKLVREIENTRATLVSKLDKKGKSPFKRKRKKKGKSNDDVPNYSGYKSVSEEDIPKLDIENTSESSEGCNNYECDLIDSSISAEDESEYVTSESNTHQTKHIKHRKSPESVFNKRKIKKPEKTQMISQQQQTSSVLLQSVALEDKSVQAFLAESRRTRLEIPLDTRISDRIKSRATVFSGPDFCDTVNRGTVCTCDDFNRPPCFCNKKPTIADKSTSYSGVKLGKQSSEADGRYHAHHHTQTNPESGQDHTLHQDSRHSIVEKQSKGHNGSLPVEDEIPTKPKIILQPSTEKSSVPIIQSKVNYYDHENRFSKEYTRNESVVEKIEDADLRVSPGIDCDVQYYDKVYKRDRDAQIRGQRALEKERIHKEYKELLQKLPALQRKERIGAIASDKPEYHMSEERLQEKERKRQNRMENAFDKVFPQRKAAVVTIPQKTHGKPDINLTPFKTTDSVEGSPVLNLGEWDVEPKPIKDKYEEEPNKDKERKKQLKAILESLQNQKKMLLQEIQSLPEEKSFYEFLDKLSTDDLKNSEKTNDKSSLVPRKDTFQTSKYRHEELNRRKIPEESDTETYETEDRDESHKGKEKSKHMKDSVHSGLLNTSVESSKVNSQRRKLEKYKKRHEKCFISETATSPTSPLPRKKAKMKKYKKRMLILQNCSTQTTPIEIKPPEKLITMKYDKLESDKVSSNETSKSDKTVNRRRVRSPKNEKSTSKTSSQDYGNEENICPKKHIPCECIHSNKTDFPEDFCKIIIKIRDDEKPEVVVSPPERSKDVEIVTEKPKDKDVTNYAGKENYHEEISGENSEKRVREKMKSIVTEPHPQKEKAKKSSNIHGADKSRPTIDIKENADVKVNTEVKAKSWREQLGKNSSGETTSTSYYSPPDFAKIRTKLATQPQPQAQSTLTDSALPQIETFNYDHLLKNKPQQRNMHDSSAATSNSGVPSVSPRPRKQLDPKLITYIKKLITMSRKSINDLGASTTSDVSTPSQSIVDVESNKPLNQLQNIMKYFNLNTADLQHHLSYSSDGSHAQFKTQENLTLSSVSESQIYAQNSAISQNFSVASRDVTKDSGRVLSKSSESCTKRKLKNYAEIAENCNKKITNLTAMIQQIREEKMKIMQSPTVSDPDQSTKYMKLPNEEYGLNIQNEKSESSESLDQDLQKKILSIDYNLADRLKKMTPEELEQYEQELYDQIDEDPKSSVSMSDSDKELFARLQNLLHASSNVVKYAKNEDKSSMKKSPVKDGSDRVTLAETPGTSKVEFSEKSKSSVDVPFVPLLLDIPKLPKLILNPLQPDSYGTNHKRPPPSKGLSVAKRYNGDISSHIPHELSTIVEADSQLSTRIEQSPSSKFSCLSLKKLGVGKQEQTDMNNQNYIPLSESSPKISNNTSNGGSKSLERSEGKSIPPALSESDQSIINMLNEIHKSLNSSSENDTRESNNSSKKIVKFSATSSSDKSDIDAVEQMLRSIGMDWAVTTLRKTKEALALSSSSSSLDFNLKASKTKSRSSKSSDVSLKEFLAQQITGTISSSTLKSDASTPTDKLLGESQELSTIQFSVEKSQQRTSTPIQSSSKSMDKSKSPCKMFTGESDISSVENNSKDRKKELSFHSLSEVSSNS